MKQICDHCKLSYEMSSLKHVKGEDGEVLYFCCNGCESVYKLLKSSSLSSFYDKLGQNTLTPPVSNSKDLSYFDTEVFAKKYIQNLDGASSISLIIENIHCAACVWLNEKVLDATEGIIEASINYTNNKAKIVFDSNIIKVSEIIQVIQSIGYDAYAYDPKVQEERDSKSNREYYIKVIVALFATMNIMWVAIAQYLGSFLGMDRETKDILNLASFILATPVVFYSGSIFFRLAYYGLKKGFVGMDLLVSVGVSITYIYSIYAGVTHAGETYFESVAMIITFVLIGKFLEQRSRKKAGDSLDKLNNFLPESICVLDNDNNLTLKSPENVAIGERIQALPGEKIAIDGILESPSALLDLSAINGESLPKEILKGEEIISGAINLNLAIVYKSSKEFSTSLMNRIIQMVQDASNSRPDIQNIANAISQRFSKVVLSVAMLTFIGWIFYVGANVENALVVAVSVIIIACPCALALATPIASVVGIGEAYKKNILFKKGKYLETLAKVDALLVDKTGTITKGKPEVIKSHYFTNIESFVDILGSFISFSKHPISQSVARYIGDFRQIEIKDFTQIDSKGILAQYEDKELIGGSRAFLESRGIVLEDLDMLDIKVDSMFFGFGIGKKLVAIFMLEDEIKQNAKEMISYAKNIGMDVIMLSGDTALSVEKVANIVGIEKYHYEIDPIKKSEVIDALHNQGKIVAMVGDGINDALALRKSDIAISMGAGSDIAISTSDVVLLDDRLDSLKNAFKIAKNTFGTIKQNIAFSVVYNAITIPLAIMGYVIPLFAALSMSFSSIIVVLNSLKIRSKG